MASSKNPHITDELLSAYIDNAVTEDERQRVEKAVAADPNVAWRLDSLRHTVQLLKHLPELAPPRSFALTMEAVSARPDQQVAAPFSARVKSSSLAEKSATAAGWGDFWRVLFQGGNLFLRNAAAGAALVFLMLIGANFALPSLQRINLSSGTIGARSNTSIVVASAQPLATLTQIVNGVGGALADAAGTPETPLAQQAEMQAQVAESADVQENSLETASNTSAADENTPIAVAKQAPVTTEAGVANAPAAAESVTVQNLAMAPTATPPAAAQSLPEAAVMDDATTDSTAADDTAADDATATEMVTASSIADAAEAESPRAGITAERGSAPANMAQVSPYAADATALDEAMSDPGSARNTGEAAAGSGPTEENASNEEAFINSENLVVARGYTNTGASAISPLSAESATENTKESAAPPQSVAQVPPAPEPGAQEAASPAMAANANLEDSNVNREPELNSTTTVNALTPNSLLWYAQLIAAICTLGFALLWWRSRR